MPLKVSKIRTIAYNISFLINGLLLSVFLPLPWPYFCWVLVGSVFYLSLGIIGLYGIIKENWSTLCYYSNILILVVIFKAIGIFILVAAIKNSTSLVEKFLALLISKYDIDMWFREKMDYIQEAGQCCGIFGYYNWNRSLAPESCCMNIMNFRNNNGTETFVCKYYEKGCLHPYEEKFVMACILLILVLMIKIILNVCAIFDGFYLVRKYRQIANKHVPMENAK